MPDLKISERTTKNYPSVEEEYIPIYCNPDYLHKSRAISQPVPGRKNSTALQAPVGLGQTYGWNSGSWPGSSWPRLFHPKGKSVSISQKSRPDMAEKGPSSWMEKRITQHL
jgi:hypothetical protein